MRKNLFGRFNPVWLIAASLFVLLWQADGAILTEANSFVGKLSQGTISAQPEVKVSQPLTVETTATKPSVAVSAPATQTAQTTVSSDNDFLGPAGICAQIYTDLGSDGYPVVGFVFPDGPAYAAGLRPGDSIVVVNGKHIHNWSVHDVVREVRGEPCTTVDITVLHPDQLPERQLHLVRHMIPDSHSAAATNDNDCLGPAGIWAKLSWNGDYAEIESVIPGGPADDVRLVAGDVILAVNDHEKRRHCCLRDLVQDIRGRDGTYVQLTVLHPNHQQEEVLLKRRDLPVSK